MRWLPHPFMRKKYDKQVKMKGGLGRLLRGLRGQEQYMNSLACNENHFLVIMTICHLIWEKDPYRVGKRF